MMYKVLLDRRVVAMVVLFGAAYWGGKHSFMHVAAASQTAVRPYVMQYVRVAPGEGREKIASEVTEYRRRDGSTVEIDTEYDVNGRLLGKGRRIGLSDGLEVLVLDTGPLTKSTTRMSNDELAAKKMLWETGSGRCVLNGEHADGEEALAGQRAIRVIKQEGADARMLIWRLQDYDCAVIQTVRQMRADDTSPWRTAGSTRLVSFVETDPPDSAFTDWTAHEEVGPSEIRGRFYRQSGITPEQCPTCFAKNAHQEARYKSRRP